MLISDQTSCAGDRIMLRILQGQPWKPMKALDVAQEGRDVVVHGAERGVAADVGDLSSGGDLTATVAASSVTVASRLEI